MVRECAREERAEKERRRASASRWPRIGGPRTRSQSVPHPLFRSVVGFLWDIQRYVFSRTPRKRFVSTSSLSSTTGGIPAKRPIMDGHVQLGSPFMGPLSENVCETIQIPENTVGLVIGKGGSEIQNIQTQSGCRVQMSPDSEINGSGVRNVSLQGNKVNVERAKQMISDVVNRAAQRQSGNYGGPTSNNASVTEDMMIPANKCGLIIGKQGETIKQLQEQAGCKIQMIQDTQEVTGIAKPLRISGDREKVETAKRLVSELLAREDGAPAPGGRTMSNFNNTPLGPNTMRGEVLVPRTSVGIIIGKGGETIKKLAAETGTKIQFKPDDDPSTADRCAVIMGTREQIYKATDMITELVNKSANNMTNSNQPQELQTFFMHVPTTKTGLVIGKGGETIKQINAESGAHCELSREPPPNAHEKVFIIKGTPFQIHHAQHIIRIKVGDIAPNTPVPPLNGHPMPQLAANGFNQPGQFGQYPQQVNPQMGQWGGQYGGVAGAPDPAQAQAWNANQYYANAQAAQYMQQGSQYQQQLAAAGQPAGGYPAQAGGQPGAAQGQPVINPATGQPDYSAQWAEYYRSLGMHDKAAMIEKQSVAARGSGGAPSGAGAPAAGAPQGASTGGQAPAQQFQYPAQGAQGAFPQTGQFQAPV